MIGVAIVGTGAIAGVHVDAYQQFPDRCEIRALSDITSAKAERLAKEKNLESAKVYADFRATIDRPEIDLVSICVPPSVHAEIAVYALNAGKHVLVEKPMASSLEQCDAMLAAAERTGRRLSVVAQNRFKTPMVRMKRILEDRRAGRIFHVTVNSYWWRGQSYYDLWWRGTWQQEVGGCTINHAVHHADLLLWMMGLPEKVIAYFANLNHLNSETEDFSTAVLVYPNGFVAQLTASLVHHGEEQEMVFQAEKARISIPWKICASTELDNGFPQQDAETERILQELYESIPPCRHDGHAGQVENVLTSIAFGDDLVVDGLAGRRTVELIMGIYKAAQSGSAVSLPLSKRDPFYRTETMLPLMPRFHRKTRSRDDFDTSTITLGRQV